MTSNDDKYMVINYTIDVEHHIIKSILSHNIRLYLMVLNEHNQIRYIYDFGFHNYIFNIKDGTFIFNKDRNIIDCYSSCHNSHQYTHDYLMELMSQIINGKQCECRINKMNVNLKQHIESFIGYQLLHINSYYQLVLISSFISNEFEDIHTLFTIDSIDMNDSNKKHVDDCVNELTNIQNELNNIFEITC